MGKQHHEQRQEAAGASSRPETVNNPTEQQNPSSQSSSAPVAPVLSDEEKARIQRMAQAAGGRRSGLYKLPNGDIRMDITIPVESAAILESQAECAGEDLEQFIQRNVIEALMAYICSAAG